MMSDDERSLLRSYLGGNRILVVTGEDATGIVDGASLIHFRACPGKDYSDALQKDFAAVTSDREDEFLNSLKSEGSIRVVASPMVATSIARVDGNPHVFFANFAGLQGGVNPVQIPQTGAQVTIAGATKGRGFFLPFLGNTQPLEGAVNSAGITYNLPAIEKGAVFWYEP